jgi:hypothetical protein
LLLCSVGVAQNFSVSVGALDTLGGAPPGDDILIPCPAPILPGTPPPPLSVGIDVDAFSYGRGGLSPGTTYLFSVDFGSVGTAGSAVEAEFLSAGGVPGHANVDVFKTDLISAAGTNSQVHDGNGLGPGGTASPLGMAESSPPTLDPTGPGVDGYDSRLGPGPFSGIYWSFDGFAAAASGISPSGSAADVLISPTVAGFTSSPSVYASSTALGLGFLGPDDIDALEVYDTGVIGVYDAGDIVLFSLDPFSASLVSIGATPGDVLLATFGTPGPIVFVPEGSLGLAPGANLTALSVVIPEPSSFAFLAIAALGLVRRKRRATAATATTH